MTGGFPGLGSGGKPLLTKPTNPSPRRGPFDRFRMPGGNRYGGIPPTGSSNDDRQKLVENERWKYLATWLNTMAAGTIVVGILTPVFHILSEGVEKAPPVDVLTAGGYLFVVLGIAVSFHVGALGALGNLRP